MKNIFKLILLLFVFTLGFGIMGCDELENLFLNLPIEQEFAETGAGPIADTTSFCLSDYSEFNENIDNIEEITYVAAAYRTISSTPGLTGDIVASLYAADGTVLFSFTIPNVNVEDFIDNPVEIELTAAEIALLNSYLAQYQTADCYTSILEVINITAGDGPPYGIIGIVELVVELKVTI